jgi:hypothetical protein
LAWGAVWLLCVAMFIMPILSSSKIGW